MGAIGSSAVGKKVGDGRLRWGRGGWETGMEAVVAPELVHVVEYKNTKQTEMMVNSEGLDKQE